MNGNLRLGSIVVAAVVALCSGQPALAQVDWTYQELAVPLGPPGSWDDTGHRVADVVFDGATYHLYLLGGQSPRGQKAPRKLDAELNDRRHERGVLSMARPPSDLNGATSEFFIVHETSPHLDGKYSAFGKLLSGLEVVDAIAKVRRGRGDRPLQRQYIERALVFRADPARK